MFLWREFALAVRAQQGVGASERTKGVRIAANISDLPIPWAKRLDAVAVAVACMMDMWAQTVRLMRVDQVILLLGLFAALVAYVHFKRSKKKRLYGQTFDDVASPKLKPVATDDALPEKLTLKRRLAGIAFLTFWLCIWTLGIYVAGHTWLSMSQGEVGYTLLMLWLVVAIPAWFFAAWTLFRLLRGDDIKIEFDGDAN
ncbi:MAG: hypothetical protein ABJF50_13800 [Paracoccaceae bacterium]